VALDEFAERLPGERETARREAINKFAMMVGALVMARSVGKGALSEELLDTVRERLAPDETAPGAVAGSPRPHPTRRRSRR
jgi:hypothetical protein